MASVDTTSILNSLLVSVETQLKESLKEETQGLVESAISDFNNAVKECKKMIVNEQESLSIKLKELLENEVTKHKSEYEKELSNMKNIKLSLKEEMDKIKDEYSRLEIERKNAMKSFNDNLKKQMSEARNEYEELLSNINKGLFINPNCLLKKIQKESKLLRQEREAFENLKAEYGETVLPLENDTKDQDTSTVTVTTTRNESNNDSNSNDDNGDSKTCNDDNDIAIAYNDYVTIKIDDKSFCTQRRTLTQIENSKLAKLFAYKSGLLSRHKNGYYILDANPDSFKQILRLLRLRKSGRLQNNNINNTNESNDDNNSDAIATEEAKDDSASNEKDKTTEKSETKNRRVYVDATVYQELENFGLLDTFLPFIKEKSENSSIIINNGSKRSNDRHRRTTIDNNSKSSGNDSKNRKKYSQMVNDDDAVLDDEKQMGDLDSVDNVNHFVIYRSNSQNTSNHFINWDASGDKNEAYLLVSGKTITTMVKLNNSDKSRIDISTNGYYRITTRFVANVNSSANVYASIYVNGSGKHMCHRCESGTGCDKTFYFNDIIYLNSGDYIQIYFIGDSSIYKSNSPQSTYLCIEKISTSIENDMGIWQSSTSSSQYRLWNNVIKSCNLYQLKEGDRDIYFKQCGLYRVSGRLHTNHSSKGTRCCRLDFYQGMTGHNSYIVNEQSSQGSNYQCHIFDTIVNVDSLKDFIRWYDDGNGTANNLQYDEISISPISTDNVGFWRANSTNANYSAWGVGGYYNDLFDTADSDSLIIVNQAGYYRICAMITTYQSGDGQVSMYINGKEYCISRMGCNRGTRYHMHFINEIVECNKHDKIRFYTAQPYNSDDKNTLFIEKLCIE